MASVVNTNSVAKVENGVITNQITPAQKEEQKLEEKSKASSTAQKDQFLQLLVAQMKYQDPLQPTSNTEYISQYATFSSLEQMQNMSATLTMSRANEMIGKSVIINHKEQTGNVQEIEGVVDYVSFENNKAKVYVNGTAYNVDEVYSVMDDSYTQKQSDAQKFENDVKNLPNIFELKQSDAKTIEGFANMFDAFDNTTKSLIGSDIVSTLMRYVSACVESGWINNTPKET